MLNIRNRKVTNPTRSLLLSFYMRTWRLIWPVLVLWAVLALKQHLRSARYSPRARAMMRRIMVLESVRLYTFTWIQPWMVLLSKCTGTVVCTTLTSMARWMQDKTLHDCQTSKWVVKMGASFSAVSCGQPTWDKKIPSWVDWCRLNMRRDIITTERLHIRGECSHERSQTNGFGF